MEELKIKEADLQIVADMQHQIDEQNDAMQWCAMCLIKGEIVPHLEFNDVGTIKLLTSVVVNHFQDKQ